MYADRPDLVDHLTKHVSKQTLVLESTNQYDDVLQFWDTKMNAFHQFLESNKGKIEEDQIIDATFEYELKLSDEILLKYKIPLDVQRGLFKNSILK